MSRWSSCCWDNIGTANTWRRCTGRESEGQRQEKKRRHLPRLTPVNDTERRTQTPSTRQSAESTFLTDSVRTLPQTTGLTAPGSAPGAPPPGKGRQRAAAPQPPTPPRRGRPRLLTTHPPARRAPRPPGRSSTATARRPLCCEGPRPPPATAPGPQEGGERGQGRWGPGGGAGPRAGSGRRGWRPRRRPPLTQLASEQTPSTAPMAPPPPPDALRPLPASALPARRQRAAVRRRRRRSLAAAAGLAHSKANEKAGWSCARAGGRAGATKGAGWLFTNSSSAFSVARRKNVDWSERPSGGRFLRQDSQ